MAAGGVGPRLRLNRWLSVSFGVGRVLFGGRDRPPHLNDPTVEVDRGQPPRLGVAVLARLVGNPPAGEHLAEHAHVEQATPAVGLMAAARSYRQPFPRTSASARRRSFTT